MNGVTGKMMNTALTISVLLALATATQASATISPGTYLGPAVGDGPVPPVFGRAMAQPGTVNAAAFPGDSEVVSRVLERETVLDPEQPVPEVVRMAASVDVKGESKPKDGVKPGVDTRIMVRLTWTF